MDDLARRIEALESRLTEDFAGSVSALRGCREAAARALLAAPHPLPIVAAARAAVASGLAPSRAAEARAHLAEAERHEVVIGSWSSGAGEGVASRRAACELALARTWLLLAEEPDARARESVEATLVAVAAEPNGVGAGLARDVEALRAGLRARTR
jgi:hypothetical protein